MRIKRLFITSIFILATASYSGAATYYLSPTGSNANAGTSLPQAWLTLAYARSILVAGDTLLLAPGTYVGGNVANGSPYASKIEVPRAEHNYRARETSLYSVEASVDSC